MLKRLLRAIGRFSAPSINTRLPIDIHKLQPPFDRYYNLGGTFEFLGTADEGSPEFDGDPPPGVVKVFYNTAGPGGEKWHSGRVGYFHCSRLQFDHFKRSWTNWNFLERVRQAVHFGFDPHQPFGLWRGSFDPPLQRRQPFRCAARPPAKADCLHRIGLIMPITNAVAIFGGAQYSRRCSAPRPLMTR